MTQEEHNRRTLLKTGAALGAMGITGLAGCTGSNGTPTEPVSVDRSSTGTPDASSITRGGDITIGWGQGLQSMSPYKGLKADFLAKETMYDRLTRVDRNFEVQPNLAKNWEANDDFTTWTFELRENATFGNMDGQKVRAEDVKATVDFMQSDHCSGCEKDLATLESIEVVDELTVDIHLSGSDTEYPRRICETGSTFCIAPKTILEDDPSKLEETDFGSGPFTLTDWQKGSKLVFEARDDYHLNGIDDEPLPYVDTMTWKIQPDAISRVNALTDDRVDALSRLPSKLIKKAKRNANLAQQTSGLQLPIILNTTIEPFSKLKVRKAMKHALDREQLLAGISNRGALGHHDAITPIHKYYDEGMKPGATFGTTANPEKAKELLGAAGYGDGLSLPTLYYDSGRPEKQVIAQLVQQQMKNAGIEFEIQKLTEEEWLSNYWNQDDVWYISNWSTRVVDSTIPLLALRSDGKWNTPRWSNEEYDAALEDAVSATEQSTRKEALAKGQRINHDEGAWLSTVYLDIFGAYNDNVQNYNLFPSIIKDFLQYTAKSEK